jgi:hypothetical protein
MKPTVFQALSRHMLSADRIIRAKRAHSQRARQMILEMPRLLHKAAKGPLRIGTSRVKEYAEAMGQYVRVDPFAYRAGGIAAAHGERLNEKVRESMQQHVWAAWEWTLAFPILHPALMSTGQSAKTLLDGVAHPKFSAALVGTLVKDLSADHVLWGTDSVWYGSPQWQIEAMRRLEIPEDMRKKYGFPALGDANSATSS